MSLREHSHVHALHLEPGEEAGQFVAGEAKDVEEEQEQAKAGAL